MLVVVRIWVYKLSLVGFIVLLKVFVNNLSKALNTPNRGVKISKKLYCFEKKQDASSF